MNKELYLKKFFKDTYNNENLYETYLKGFFRIDPDLFSKWYKEMEIRNRLFLDKISPLRKVSPSSCILETALSQNLTVLTPLYRKRVTEVKEASFPKIEQLELGVGSHHYVCNGVYESTLQNIYNVLTNGSFSVGICTNKKTDEYRKIVKYYNTLKDFLMRHGYHVSSFESNNGSKNKVYLLMYDCEKNKTHKR